MRENAHILFAEVNRLTKEVNILRCMLDRLMANNSNLLNTDIGDCQEINENASKILL